MKTSSLRNLALAGLTTIILSTMGCGVVEKFKEQDISYKTLVGKRGDIIFYSGMGDTLGFYPNAKIIYSSSDSRAIWIEYGGKEYFLQGDVKVELKEE